MQNWSVYKHTFPNGKVYIGITSGDPLKRWSGGHGYSGQRRMFSAIVKFGWDNVQHDIVAEGLSESEAHRIEQKMISEHDENDLYNVQYVVKDSDADDSINAPIDERTHFWNIENLASDRQWYALREKLGGVDPMLVEFRRDKMIAHCYYANDGMLIVSKKEALFPDGGLTEDNFWDWVEKSSVFKEIECNKTQTEAIMAAISSWGDCDVRA